MKNHTALYRLMPFIVLFFLAGCTGSQRVDTIIFAGKVTNPESGEWLNNRLVLVFVNGKEVGRGVSSLSEYPSLTESITFANLTLPSTSDGLNDGVFMVYVNNDYGLTSRIINKEDLDYKFVNGTGSPSGFFGSLIGRNTYNFLSTWLGEIEEGALLTIPINQKNSQYSIKVLEGDLSTLPQQLQTPNNTFLRDDGTIIVALDDSPDSALGAGNLANIEVNAFNLATSSEKVDLNKVTVPINNCGGNVRISQKYIQSQTFVKEYQLDAQAGLGIEIPMPLWFRLIPELSLKYGFQQGQIDTKTVEYEMAAEAGSSLVYTITWQEIWETGQAEVVSGSGLIVIPFKAKTDIIYALDSQSFPCN